MSENRKLTTGEVVEMTVRILSNINVPVYLDDQIAAPIKHAVINLKSVQDAWAKEAQALQAAAEQAEQEPEEQEEPEQEETGEEIPEEPSNESE